LTPIDRSEGPGGRGFGPGEGLPDVSALEARLREVASRLSRALEPTHPDAALETARVLHEAVRLPDEARKGLLAAIAGAAARDPASVVRERLTAAFPEESAKRQKLGEALARLAGEDPQRLSRTALEARLVKALASLGARVAAARPGVGDVVERARRTGPFGTGPASLATPPEVRNQPAVPSPPRLDVAADPPGILDIRPAGRLRVEVECARVGKTVVTLRYRAAGEVHTSVIAVTCVQREP